VALSALSDFNVRWRCGSLEGGSWRGVRRRIDETAYIRGTASPRFFIRNLHAVVASGSAVTAFFPVSCFQAGLSVAD